MSQATVRDILRAKQALEAAELKVRNLLESGHETEDSDQ